MKTDVYERITERIIEALEAGTVPWTKPWTAGVNVPRSMSSGKPYRGVNVVLLGLEAFDKGYPAPWWGTYKQVGELGGQVRKGEKSTTVMLWKPMVREVDGESKRWFMARAFNVFNVAQAEWTDGVPERFAPPALIEHDIVAEAEALIAGYPKRPQIDIIASDRAYYRPSADTVCVPQLGQFRSVEGYYSTMFHELTHSTGHAKRLAREGVVNIDHFGSHAYSKEELIAEMGAAMLCAVTGVEPQIDQSAAYIASWLKSLQNDPKLVVQAAAQAQRAADHIRGQEVESYD